MVLVTGLALIAPGAHLFELLNKMGRSRTDYFAVQQIYAVTNNWTLQSEIPSLEAKQTSRETLETGSFLTKVCKPPAGFG